jgi:shikimate kinase
MMKVVLLGYMGSGKSSIGALLASKLEISFFDLDAVIEEEEQLSVNKIFAKKGEIYFRKKEHSVLHSLLKKKEPFVLSLGGGTPCYFNNHEVIAQSNCVSFYLKGTAETLSRHLLEEVEKRPLLTALKATELLDFINKHLFDRSFYYHQVSHIVTIDAKTIDEIADELFQYLR